MDNPTLSPTAKELPIGNYRHYKGGSYRVLGVGLHSETLEELVIYQAQYGERLIWVRPLAMFTQLVTVDGVSMPRFQLVNTDGKENRPS